jgi:DNA-directed RNA polymerase subunit RPC12/RpoP
MIDEEYDGTKCTTCGREFKWVGKSIIDGICLHCFMEIEDKDGR